jgi:hypothetical protein
MRRSWPAYLLVVIVAAAAGVAIAGFPKSEPKLIIPAQTTSTSATTAVDPPSSTTSVAQSLAPVPTTTPPTTQVAESSTTGAPATTPSTTTTPPPTSAAAFNVDRSTVRLVIANANGRTGLASGNAARLAALGYTQIDLGDATQKRLQTTVYYRHGFIEQAGAVAADLGIADVPLLEIPADLAQPLTNSDDAGDVIVLLGADAPL